MGAYTAFLSKGWSGIATPARGRRCGQGRKLTPEEEAELQGFMLAAPPPARGGRSVSNRAVDGEYSSAHSRAMGVRARATAARWSTTMERAGMDLLPMAELAAEHAALAGWRRRNCPASPATPASAAPASSW